MIEIHHVWMDTDIDYYNFITLELKRELDDWEGHDIIQATSLFHFFEVINTEWDGVEDVYKHLCNLCESGDFPYI